MLFYRSGFFVFLWIFPFAAAIVISVIKKRNDILTGDTDYARWYHASRSSLRDLAKARSLLRENRMREFYDHIFEMAQSYFGTRLGISSGGVSGKVLLELVPQELLKGHTIKQIEDIFSDCYLARFTSIDFDLSDMKKTYADIKDIIAYFNEIRNI